MIDVEVTGDTVGILDRAKAFIAGAPECNDNVPQADVPVARAQTLATGFRSHGATVVAGSHRERDDGYRAVVTMLSEKWRVITCRDGEQWIIQRRDGARNGRPRWTGVHYCVTKSALLRLCRAVCDRIDPSAENLLADLPDTIGGLSDDGC